MIDNILSETFCLFVPVLCFPIFTAKLILWPKRGLTCAISIVNCFLFIIIKKYVLLFFTDFKLLMFHNNIVKISEILNKSKLVQTTYPINFCIFCNHFYYEKKMKIFNFLKPMTKIKRFVHR